MRRKDTEEKNRQLGMDFSTATHRLHRQLMFRLIQEAGRDTCARCGRRITEGQSWFVDHLRAWLYTPDPMDLFFDLNNIVFSHEACDKRSRRCPSIVKTDSGFKGVFWDEKALLWEAVIWLPKMIGRGRRKRLGHFTTAAEAALAYDREAVMIYGDRATTNYSLGLIRDAD